MNNEILKEINENLKEINERLSGIEKIIGIVKDDCNHMNVHINFIENVYETLKKPLRYLTGESPVLKIKGNVNDE